MCIVWCVCQVEGFILRRYRQLGIPHDATPSDNRGTSHPRSMLRQLILKESIIIVDRAPLIRYSAS
jgi:hypothetical protein